MQYLVELGGQTYGPADVTLLQQWVNENRVLPDTVVRESATGRAMTAKEVPGLSFPQVQPPQQPYQSTFSPPRPEGGVQGDFSQGGFSQPPTSNYYRPGAGSGIGGSVDTNPVLIKSIIVTLCCCTVGGIVAIVYVVQANTHNTYGRFDEARKALKTGDTWANVSIGLGLVIGVIYFLLGIAGSLN